MGVAAIATDISERLICIPGHALSVTCELELVAGSGPVTAPDEEGPPSSQPFKIGDNRYVLRMYLTASAHNTLLWPTAAETASYYEHRKTRAPPPIETLGAHASWVGKTAAEYPITALEGL